MNDLYQTITDKIIAELSAGTAPWVRPWSGAADPLPRNAVSQRPYRGINNVLLGLEAFGHGYATNQWLTFRQANQLGGRVRKGEHGSTIIYYESRLAKLSLKADELTHLDDEVDELAEDEEEGEQAKLKSRWAALEKVVGSTPRIERVAADLVAHFEERNQAQHGKAMMVAISGALPPICRAITMMVS